MKLSKFANLVKNGGRCAVLHVAGSGIWLSTGTAIYRATELPDMEGSEQVRTVLDMTADAWKKVYLTEDWPESVSNVLGLNLAPYAQGEQDTEKLKVAAAPNGLWCSACRCKVDGELIFYNEAYLAPLAEEIKKSEYIYYTARQTEAGQRYLVVHDGMDVLAAIMPMNILKEEYINDLAEFQALCMEQFYKDKERREAVIEEAEDDAEDAGQIGMEGVEDTKRAGPRRDTMPRRPAGAAPAIHRQSGQLSASPTGQQAAGDTKRPRPRRYHDAQARAKF